MEMRDKILTCAQRLVQQRGFNGFSYADIANEVGIRKASLHHHFPTKADLGLSLIKVYSEQLDSVLISISGSSLPANEKLSGYIALYRGSLEAERMCLGGMLASEALTLDPVMLPSLKRFFTRNTEWLAEILLEGQSQQLFILGGSAADYARMLLSALQGALLISRATGNAETFEQTVSSLMTSLMRKG
jgi:TetR/AcrR family transcriptional repressor of nem operon